MNDSHLKKNSTHPAKSNQADKKKVSHSHPTVNPENKPRFPYFDYFIILNIVLYIIAFIMFIYKQGTLSKKEKSLAFLCLVINFPAGTILILLN